MIAHVTDSQIVSETQGALFSLIQPAPIDVMIVMKNSGQNTMNYNFQEWNGSTWLDLGSVGSPLNNTLSPNQVLVLELTSANSKIQLLGNASGGAFLEFAITRYFNRASGGAIPVLNL